MNVEIINAYKCGKCNFGYFQEDMAKRCCICDTCGKIKDHNMGMGQCHECWDTSRKNSDVARLNKMEIVQYDKSMCLFHNERFFYDSDQLWDYLTNLLPNGRPQYFVVADKKEFNLDANSIVESELENHHEEAGSDVDNSDYKFLQEQLDEFCHRVNISSWFEGESKVSLKDIEEKLGII